MKTDLRLKGNVGWISTTLLAMTLTVFVLVIAADTSESVKDKIRVETTPLVSRRISAAIYSLDAVDEGSIQLNFKESYGVDKDSGNRYVNYSVGSFALNILGKNGKSKLEAPVDYTLKEGKSSTFCVLKEEGSDVRLKPGGCRQ